MNIKTLHRLHIGLASTSIIGVLTICAIGIYLLINTKKPVEIYFMEGPPCSSISADRVLELIETKKAESKK